MLQITPQMKILVAVEPVDFRRGIDGLARLCQETLEHDPFAGTVFVFRNRRATALKVLLYDGQGFWLCHKRLSQGRFPWWPSDGGRRGAAAGRASAGGPALGRRPDANRRGGRLAAGGPARLIHPHVKGSCGIAAGLLHWSPGVTPRRPREMAGGADPFCRLVAADAKHAGADRGGQRRTGGRSAPRRGIARRARTRL